jgi:hypothetical protein
VAAPTEQYLISITENAPQRSLMEGCKPPLRQNCRVALNNDQDVQQTYLYQLSFVGSIGCQSERGCLISVAQWHPSISTNYTDYPNNSFPAAYIADFRQITYDPFYDQFAILSGGYHLYLDLFSSSYLDDPAYDGYLNYVDLEGRVDSPIVSIEWGQPVFYDPYMLMTNEWTPR